MIILRFIVGMMFVLYGTRGLINNMTGSEPKRRIGFILMDYFVAYLIMGPR